MNQPIRVLIAKPGLDGHDRGALVVAQGLRDEGLEVIYTGLRQTVEQIIVTAIQEDVDCIGLSSLSGAHMTLFPAVVEGLHSRGIDDMLIIGGGVIPPDDVVALKNKGLAEVFTPGSTIGEMAEYIRHHVSGRHEMVLFDPPSQVDHIGIAVADLEQTLAFYRDHLGFSVVHEEEIHDQQVRAVFLQAGELHIELLFSTDDEGPIGKFIAAKGSGMHHIAYRVDNVAEWIEKSKQAGQRLIDEIPRSGGQDKLIAFIHPKSSFGVLTEYCQIIDKE